MLHLPSPEGDDTVLVTGATGPTGEVGLAVASVPTSYIASTSPGSPKTTLGRSFWIVRMISSNPASPGSRTSVRRLWHRC